MYRTITAALVALAVATTAAELARAEFERTALDTQAGTAQDATLWLDDYDAALAQAEAKGRDVLVEFSGSDWCDWCRDIDRRILGTASFREFAVPRFVLCRLDFPRGAEARAAVPRPDRNQEVRSAFGVRGYPTLVVVTARGELLAETGSFAGGPEAFAKHLAEQHSIGTRALASATALLAEHATSSGEAKFDVLERAVATFGELWQAPPTQRLIPLVEEAFRSEPADERTNERGLRRAAAHALLLGRVAVDEVATWAETADAENASGLLELCIERALGRASDAATAKAAIARLETLLERGTLHDHVRIAETCANAAHWCTHPSGLDDVPRARALATHALDLGIADEALRRALRAIVDQGEGA